MPEIVKGYLAGCSINLVPMKKEEELEDAVISFNADDTGTFQVFLTDAVEDWDEYDDIVIPIPQWKEALAKFKDFIDTDEDYDTVLERLTGVDYTTWAVKDEYLMRMFGNIGAKMWADRKSYQKMIEDLIAWTTQYEDRCDSIMSKGY